MISAISTALSGLFAASKRVEAGASNIANLTTSGALNEINGPAPYETQVTIQEAQTPGVKAENIPEKPGFVNAYDPNSPFADNEGLIGVPNTNLAEETVNLKLAETAYKANLATIQTASEMSDELLNTFDDEA